MPSSARLRQSLRLTLMIVAISAAIGGAYGSLVAGEPLRGVAQGVVSAVLITMPVAVFEVVFLRGRLGRRLRRARFATIVLIRSAAYFAAIVTGLLIGDALFGRTYQGEGPINNSLLRDVGISFAISLLLNFIFEVNSALGGRVLRDLITGRYHRPRLERRVILFVDLVGSTTTAERIGSVHFLDYLAEFMADLADPVADARGDIYKYVGDEAIITWPASADAVGEAIDCLAGFTDRLAARREEYIAKFGVAPAFRAGLHVGELVVGEIGVWRREIAFLGDVMNVAARLVDTARAAGVAHVISSEALAHATLPPGTTARPLGAISLRGRTGEIEACALERAGA